MYLAARGLTEIGVNVKIEYLGNLKNPLSIWRACHRVRDLSHSYDLVHAQYGSACAAATSLGQTPLLLTIRGNDWNLHNETFGLTYLHTRLARAMTLASLKRYQMVLCVSQSLCRELKVHVQHDCFIEYHPSPISLSQWPIRREIKPRARPPYRVLFTANCLSDPIKRLGLLRKAVEIASRRLGKIELVYANGVSHSQMPGLVSTCDAVACTSETEGWPNSIKEALACGLPFVSTDVSDLREIAEIDSSCRITKANPEAFAQGLCDVLATPWTPDLRRHVKAMDIQISSKKLKAQYIKVLNKAHLKNL